MIANINHIEGGLCKHLDGMSKVSITMVTKEDGKRSHNRRIMCSR
jgi:hypothetical protein